MSNYNTRILTCVIVVFLSIFFLVTIFAAHTDPWWQWFYNFQTMLAAILAIVAAFISIQETRRAEAEATIRHRETIEEQRRADVRRLARAETPAANILTNFAINSKRLLAWYNEEAVAAVGYSARLIIHIRLAAEELALAAQSPSLREAVDLFHPRMTMRYRSLTATAEQINRVLTDLRTYERSTNSLMAPETLQSPEVLQATMKLARYIMMSREEAETFAKDLRDLKDSFPNGGNALRN